MTARILIVSMLLIYSTWLNAQSTAISLYESEHFGDATYYTGLGSAGNCQIMATLPAWGNQLDFKVALNQSQYTSGDMSAGCGTCLSATYLGTGLGNDPPPQQFTALVVDRCPECIEGDLDLHAEPQLDGRWDIAWSAIDCPVGNTTLAYLFEGSNPFYIKMGVRNHRIAIKSLQVQPQTNGPFFTAERTSDNFFTCSACTVPYEFPMAVRIQGINNQIITDTVPGMMDDVLITGSESKQFESIDSIIFVDDFEDFGF
ncbi:hypothetical protein [Marinicella litoralis]|nr:hypothetical protein [Marinicella litoralis]